MSVTRHTAVAKKVADFFSSYPTREYRNGDIVIFGETGLASVFYIESGEVLEYAIANSGDRFVLNTFKDGAFFPMSNAVNEVDTPYFFEALGEAVLREAPAPLVVEFLQQNTDVMFDLLQRTFRGVDGLLARLAGTVQETAADRIVRELTILGERFGFERTSFGKRVSHKVSEMQLAEKTGLARETVSRTIKKLKSQGVLSSERGYYTFLSRSSKTS